MEQGHEIREHENTSEGNSWTKERLLSHTAFQNSWYHRIEFFPDLFSPGKDRPNLLTGRRMLRGCQIEGQRVLDIGAMDCLMTLLALRRGAERVVSYDRVSCIENVQLIKNFFGVEFEYFSGMSLNAMPTITREVGAYPFDVVIFSGVLYHMFDPMAGLAWVRGLVRDGGLVIIETAAIIDAGFRLHFNAAGRFYPEGTTYWLGSLDCLDYLCRFLRLAPTDCAYIHGGVSSDTGLQICRIAILCRAVDQVLVTEDDNWFNTMAPGIRGSRADFSEFMNFDELALKGKEELAYRRTTQGLVFRNDNNTIDLYKSVLATEPMRRQNGIYEKLCLGEKY